MRLEDIYPHYNKLPIHDRRYFVDQMIRLRTQECIAIQEAKRRPPKREPKITGPKPPVITLTPAEEALCKTLGLSKRQLIELRRNHAATT